MTEKQSFPHFPRYYCTACGDLLTAYASQDRGSVQSHITNSKDAAHGGRSGSSVSAPITTTSTESNHIDPIWKTEADTKEEKLAYLALLRYPHLPITRSNGSGNMISKLLDTSSGEISEMLFDSPAILKLRIRAAHEYTTDDFTRPIEDITLNPVERLVHKKTRKLARDTSGCSIKNNGGLELECLTVSDIVEEFNEKRLPVGKPESPVIDSTTTVSPKQVEEILNTTVHEVWLPSVRNHAVYVHARQMSDATKEAAKKSSEILGEENPVHKLTAATSNLAWEALNGSALMDLVYRPEAVAKDFYAVLQKVDLRAPER